MNTKVLSGLVLLVLVGAGVFAYMAMSKDEKMAKNDTPVVVSQEQNTTNQASNQPVAEEAIDTTNSNETENDSENLATVDTSVDIREEEVIENVNDTITAELDYTNGTYKSQVSYALPNGGSHEMDVELSITDDIVTSVSVVFDGDVSGGSTAIQSRFAGAMQPEVLGNKVDSISLSRTGGASLTTVGFNNALAEIKAQAKS